MSDTLKGICLMILAMAGFAAGDLGIKLLAEGGMPTGAIMRQLGLGGTLVFALWTLSAGQKLWHRDLGRPAILVRYTGEVAAALCMVTALALTPLSSVTAILQAAPLVVAMGAAVFFGEQVGWRRWTAILIGLLGVLIIIRPGTDAFSVLSLLSVGAMLALAIRDLATRAAPKTLSNLQMATFGFTGLILAGLILMPFEGTGTPATPARHFWMVFTILTTVGGYYAITAAMRIGEMSAISPFRYSRLLFGLILGVTIFGERPDAWMLVGAALVVGSGVYAVLRERRLAQIAGGADTIRE